MGRERLMALLWHDSDAEHARGALKQMLYVLRRRLGATEATAGTAELRLDRRYVDSDVQRFREALEQGDAERAVDAYAGVFLEGVHLDGGSEFERWATERRAELERLHAEALEALATAAEATGDPRAAVGWWRRLQATEPLNSRVALEVMAALAAAGDRAGALRHASVHEALLRHELGVPGSSRRLVRVQPAGDGACARAAP